MEQAGAADAEAVAKIPGYHRAAVTQAPDTLHRALRHAAVMVGQRAVLVEKGQILIELAVHPGEIAANDKIIPPVSALVPPNLVRWRTRCRLRPNR